MTTQYSVLSGEFLAANGAVAKRDSDQKYPSITTNTCRHLNRDAKLQQVLIWHHILTAIS